MYCSALSLLSGDAKERSHGFMGLLTILQSKPGILQLVSDPTAAGQGVSDSGTLLLFCTALAWRDTSDLSGEDGDVYLALRGMLVSLRTQLGELNQTGIVVDKRLVGIYALFRFLSESFGI